MHLCVRLCHRRHHDWVRWDISVLHWDISILHLDDCTAHGTAMRFSHPVPWLGHISNSQPGNGMGLGGFHWIGIVCAVKYISQGAIAALSTLDSAFFSKIEHELSMKACGTEVKSSHWHDAPLQLPLQCSSTSQSACIAAFSSTDHSRNFDCVFFKKSFLMHWGSIKREFRNFPLSEKSYTFKVKYLNWKFSSHNYCFRLIVNPRTAIQGCTCRGILRTSEKFCNSLLPQNTVISVHLKTSNKAHLSILPHSFRMDSVCVIFDKALIPFQCLSSVRCLNWSVLVVLGCKMVILSGIWISPELFLWIQCGLETQYVIPDEE